MVMVGLDRARCPAGTLPHPHSVCLSLWSRRPRTEALALPAGLSGPVIGSRPVEVSLGLVQFAAPRGRCIASRTVTHNHVTNPHLNTAPWGWVEKAGHSAAAPVCLGAYVQCHEQSQKERAGTSRESGGRRLPVT